MSFHPDLNLAQGGAGVLIVEDDRDTADTMAMLLHLIGHRVRVARSGHQAVDEARREPPGFILLDLGLPGLDGYELAQRLRREMPTSPVLIAITGHSRAQDRARAAWAGIDHFFAKPLEDESMEALLGLLGAGVAASAGSPAAAALPGHDGAVPALPGAAGAPSRIVSLSVRLTNSLGLHLRAASRLARLACAYEAEITVGRDGQFVDGRSVMDLLTLGAARGSWLEVRAEGLDALAAVHALADLIADDFGELDG